MNRFRILSIFLILAMIFSVANVSPARAATYALTDLGTLGGNPSYATAINEAGQVTGYSYLAGNITSHAFVWDSGGGMTDLGTLGGDFSYAYTINEAGQVVGSSSLAGNASQHAFLWDSGGGMTDLGTLGGSSSVALDINEAGQVVGQADTASGQARAFMWDSGGGMINLGTLGGNYSQATAINEAGQVTGFSYLAGNISSHAFVWDSAGGMIDLGTLGGNYSQARAINEAGQVVGYSHTAGNASQHAFLWDSAGGMINLGTLGGNDSLAFDVNEAGQVVGYSYTAGNAGYRAFVWDSAGGMIDVGALGGPNSIANAINEAGEIVGIAALTGETEYHAFVTMPANQPPTASAGGPYQGGAGTAIALNGATASDPDVSDILTYSWSVNSASCSFDNPNLLNPNLTCTEVGSFIATLEVSDGVNPPVTSDATVNVIFNFTGFYQPVDNLPTWNSVNAGRAIPIKFSLGGDQGLNIFAAGYPKSEAITCNSTDLVDGIEETVSPGSSSLSYDPGSDRYHYVWKTQKSWANSCRQLVVKFVDGTTQRANFKFK